MSVGSQPISNGSARTSCFWQSVSAEPKQSARAKAAQRPRPWRFGVSVSVVLGGSFVFPSASLSFAVLGSVFQSHHAAPRASCSSPLSYTSALPFRGEYACPRLLSCPFWPSRALRAFACIHKCTSLSTSSTAAAAAAARGAASHLDSTCTTGRSTRPLASAVHPPPSRYTLSIVRPSHTIRPSATATLFLYLHRGMGCMQLRLAPPTPSSSALLSCSLPVARAD